MYLKKCFLFFCSVILVIVVLVLINILKNGKYQDVSSLEFSMDIYKDDELINWDKFDINEITLEDELVINSEGVYKLSGNLINESIIIDTKGDVKVILDGVNIKNSNSSIIMVENARSVTIYLEEGSKNYLECYSENEEIEGVIYSKDDLIFDGSGYLSIKTNNNAIVSKDNVKIIDGNYDIVSEKNGIIGKDSVYIVNGEFNINSKSNSIKSSNSKDKDKGFIYIKDGKFVINSFYDGIEASNSILIDNGDINIATLYEGDDKSSKGIKANNNILIKDGKFVISSNDDGIHSNGTIGISGGEYVISTLDDGIRADDKIIIDAGSINIKESHEGIEASNILINGGFININSNEDGLNASSKKDNKIVISDGKIYINASGDGIDSNGSVYVYGGLIYINGPDNEYDGALDYDDEFIMNGGVLFAVSYKDMAQGISNNSKQYSVMISLDKVYDNSKINLISLDDTVLETFITSKSFNNIVISSNRLVKSKTYKLEIDGEVVKTFKVKDISTILE